MKLRMDRALWANAVACADSIDFGFEEWVCGVVRQHLAGKFDGVPFPREWLNGTRAASACVWVRVPAGVELDGDAVRLAVAGAVGRYLPKVPPRFDPGLEEGRDFVVEHREGW